MILYPLYVFYQLYLGDFSPFYIFGLSKAYELWIDYLTVRKLNTNKLITQANNTLKLMESVNDVDMDDMLLLLLFIKSQNSD